MMEEEEEKTERSFNEFEIARKYFRNEIEATFKKLAFRILA